MATLVITDNLKEELVKFLKKNRKTDLTTTYLHYLEKKFNIKPVLFPRDKMIYQSQEDLIKRLEAQGKLWRETEIKIQFGQQSVNEQTKKIYICPFTGKVFGDNTCPNPQDAIYDWVSRCPENTERSGGLKVKRFFVSEDPEVIKNYVVKQKEPIKKMVFSSAVTGKLFNSKQAVIEDLLKNQIKLFEFGKIFNQNLYEIEADFLSFIQKQLDESQVSAFFEAISGIEELAEYIKDWQEEPSDEASENQ
jgi:hypothetical protein